jgi:hypothetical protein
MPRGFLHGGERSDPMPVDGEKSLAKDLAQTLDFRGHGFGGRDRIQPFRQGSLPENVPDQRGIGLFRNAERIQNARFAPFKALFQSGDPTTSRMSQSISTS